MTLGRGNRRNRHGNSLLEWGIHALQAHKRSLLHLLLRLYHGVTKTFNICRPSKYVQKMLSAHTRTNTLPHALKVTVPAAPAPGGRAATAEPGRLPAEPVEPAAIVPFVVLRRVARHHINVFVGSFELVRRYYASGSSVCGDGA